MPTISDFSSVGLLALITLGRSFAQDKHLLFGAVFFMHHIKEITYLHNYSDESSGLSLLSLIVPCLPVLQAWIRSSRLYVI